MSLSKILCVIFGLWSYFIPIWSLSIIIGHVTPKGHFCSLVDINSPVVFILIFLPHFVLFSFGIVILYLRIWFSVRKQKKQVFDTKDSADIKAHKLTITLILVVGIFILLNVPSVGSFPLTFYKCKVVSCSVRYICSDLLCQHFYQSYNLFLQDEGFQGCILQISSILEISFEER